MAASLPTSEPSTSLPGGGPSLSKSAAPAPGKASAASASRPPRPKARPPPLRRPPSRASAEHRKWKKIEWVWTLVPVALLLTVGVASAGLLYSLGTGPTAYGVDPNYQVNVTGQQWLWSFQYANSYDVAGKALPSNVTNPAYIVGANGQKYPALYVPQNAVVWLNVTSIDVIHDFNVYKLGVRIDAIPGRINHYWFTIPAGAPAWTEYLVQCTEFCGQGHYNMLAYVVVTPASSCLTGGECPGP